MDDPDVVILAIVAPPLLLAMRMLAPLLTARSLFSKTGFAAVIAGTVSKVSPAIGAIATVNGPPLPIRNWFYC